MATAALTVDLNARIAQFETEFKRATSTLDKFGKKGDLIAAGLKGAFAGMSAGAFVAFTKSIIDAGDELDKLAKRTNIAVKDLASLDLIAQQSDTNLDVLAKGINRLSVSLAEAAGDNKELAQAFKDLGVTAKDPIEAMYQLADATKNTTDSNKTNADLMKVLSKSYQEWLPFLREGGDGLREAAARSNDYAVAMAKLSPVAAAFNDNIAALRTELKTTVAEGMTPFIVALNDIAAAYVNADNQSIAFSTWGERFGNAMKGYVIVAEAFITVFKDVTNTAVYGSAAVSDALAGNFKQAGHWIKQLGLRYKETGEEYTRFANAVALGVKVEPFKPTGVATGDQTAQMECVMAGGKWSGGKCIPKKKTGSGGGAKPDPLASLLGSTDIGKTQEYNKLLGLLNARFDSGRKSSEQYRQALEKLNEQFGRASIDVFDSGSFKTTSKEVAEFIKAQQDAINGLNGEMAQEGVAAAEAFESALASLISDTTVMKTEELHKQVAILDKALFDGAISADIHAEALSKITDGVPEKLKETKSLAEELGLSFTSAFEDAIVGGKSFSDVLKGLEQDIIRIATRKLVTEPMGEFVSGAAKNFDWSSLFASANGNALSNGAGLSAYSGSIVSRPTVFPFASGMGLMGEAGPEAILPLKRGSNGKLGVASEGGGGSTVIMNISTPDANSFRASQGQITAQMTRALARGRRYS